MQPPLKEKKLEEGDDDDESSFFSVALRVLNVDDASRAALTSLLRISISLSYPLSQPQQFFINFVLENYTNGP